MIVSRLQRRYSTAHSSDVDKVRYTLSSDQLSYLVVMLWLNLAREKSYHLNKELSGSQPVLPVPY